MPIYEHTWDRMHGFHTRVVCDEPDGWEHPRKRRLPEFLMFTVNHEMWDKLHSAEPAERVEIFRTEYALAQRHSQYQVLKCRRQNEPIIAWTDQEELNYYLSSQFTDIERYLWRIKHGRG